MGWKGGIEVEGALGRRGEIVVPPMETESMDATNLNAAAVGTGATQELDGMDLGNLDESGSQLEKEDEPMLGEQKAVQKEEDKDTMVTDADGVPEREEGADTRREEGPDAVDSTTL